MKRTGGVSILASGARRHRFFSWTIGSRPETDSSVR